MPSQDLRRTLIWVVGGLLVAALAARWVMQLPDSAPASNSNQRFSSGSSGSRSSGPSSLSEGSEAGSASSRAATTLTVHVAGMVAHPGVYRLSAGARTYEAIAAAGGAARGSDQNALSLAARVADGATILVPAKSRAIAGAASGSSTLAGSSAVGATSAPVSLSNATAQQLDGLDGIGPALAKRIVQWRDAHGGFGSLGDLDSVPGIGPAKLAALKGAVVP